MDQPYPRQDQRVSPKSRIPVPSPSPKRTPLSDNTAAYTNSDSPCRIGHEKDNTSPGSSERKYVNYRTPPQKRGRIDENSYRDIPARPQNRQGFYGPFTTPPTPEYSDHVSEEDNSCSPRDSPTHEAHSDAMQLSPCDPRSSPPYDILSPDAEVQYDLPLFSSDEPGGLAIQTNRSTIKVGRKKKEIVGPWIMGKMLGKGTSGEVRMAKHATTGQIAAIKRVKKHPPGLLVEYQGISGQVRKMGGTLPYGLEKEVAIMKLMDHPNVISLIDVWESGSEVYIVVEYVDGGELFNFLVKNQRLSESTVMVLFRQIMSAVYYFQCINVCHRDLKPENILMTMEGKIKIADFGLAALSPKGYKLTTSCGSPHYAAPEVISGTSYDGRKADIWSCGVILFTLLAGRTPFDSEDINELLEKVRVGVYDMPEHFTPEAKALVWNMIQLEPKKRIRMAEIWKHPLMVKYSPEVNLQTGLSKDVMPAPITYRDVVGAVVDDLDEIDAETLRNLQTLHSGRTEEQLLCQLVCNSPNGVKIAYCLLIRYRNGHPQNYPGLSEYDKSGANSATRRLWVRENKHHVYQNVDLSRTVSTVDSINYYTKAEDIELDLASTLFEGDESGELDYTPTFITGACFAKGGTASAEADALEDQPDATDVGHVDSGELDHDTEVVDGGGVFLKEHQALFEAQKAASAQKAEPYDNNGKRRFTTAMRPSTTIASILSCVSSKSTQTKKYVAPTHKRHSSTVSISHVRTSSIASGNQYYAGDDHMKSIDSPDEADVVDPRRLSAKVGTFQNALDMKRRSRELEKFCGEQAYWTKRFSMGVEDEETQVEDEENFDTSLDSMAATLGTTGHRTTGLSVLTRKTSRVFLRRYRSDSLVTTSTVAQDGSEQTSRRSVVCEEEVIAELEKRLAKRTVIPRRVQESEADRVLRKRARKLEEAAARLMIFEGDESSDSEYGASNYDEEARYEDADSIYQEMARRGSPAQRSENDDTQGGSGGPSAQGTYAEASVGQHSQDLSGIGVGGQDDVPLKASPLKPKRSFLDLLKGKKASQILKPVKTENQPEVSISITAPVEENVAQPKNSLIEKLRRFASRDVRAAAEVDVRKTAAPLITVTSVGGAGGSALPVEVRAGGEEELLDEDELDNIGRDEFKRVVAQRGWLKNVFKGKPAFKLMCFNRPAAAVYNEISTLFQTWRSFGIVVAQDDNRGLVVRARVTDTNCLELKEIRVVAEVRVCTGSRTKGTSVVRFTQEKGPVSSFNKIFHEMSSHLADGRYVVTDPLNTSRMEKIFAK